MRASVILLGGFIAWLVITGRAKDYWAFATVRNAADGAKDGEAEGAG